VDHIIGACRLSDHDTKTRAASGIAPEALVFDLVEWIAREPRSYAEVIDAWRTSCPRLTVWEDAVDRGLVKRKAASGCGTQVVVTDSGWRFLRDQARKQR
jgi:hypothetical protein